MSQNAEELRNKRLRMGVLYQRESTDRPTYNLYSDLDRMNIMEYGVHDDETNKYDSA